MSPLPSVEFVIPVLNEERALPGSVERLHGYLSEAMQAYDWRIVVADNGSTDRTPAVCAELSSKHEEVGYLRLEERGRGRALRTAWLAGDADYLCYMDVDLSTELEAIPPLIDSLATGGNDLAVGSRLDRGSNVIGRTLKREVVSRCYNLIIRSMFFVRFRDAQCGFKAISRSAAHELAPLVLDNGWFFDTELLILAEKNGYRIAEIPVRWEDDPDTRVKIVKTAYDDMMGLFRLRFGGLRKASRRLGEGLRRRRRRNCSDFVRALDTHSHRHTRESGYPQRGWVFASSRLNSYKTAVGITGPCYHSYTLEGIAQCSLSDWDPNYGVSQIARLQF